jgi:hypothetical protein
MVSELNCRDKRNLIVRCCVSIVSIWNDVS